MTIKSTPTHEPAGPDWTPIRRVVTIGSFVVIILVLGYVMFIPKYEAAQANNVADVAIILAPVVAAAAAIERVLETTFDLVETRASKAVAFLAQTEKWIDLAEKEAEEARAKLITVTAKLNSALVAIEPTKVLEQEQRLKATLRVVGDRADRAEELLASVTVKSPTYRQAKRLASLYISLVMGLLIASVGSVQMLHLLGIFKGASTWQVGFDVLITGVVMATGSGPVHSVINILQQGKEALESASGFLQARQSQPRATKPGE
ncbi:MAG: hypothetical protein HYZ49_07030 [Chloroflexi bacterium]|nr:hypothetical protein [Chloroflexota bacterium]